MLLAAGATVLFSKRVLVMRAEEFNAARLRRAAARHLRWCEQCSLVLFKHMEGPIVIYAASGAGCALPSRL